MIKPSKIIGSKTDPYLLRWHLIPRNPLFNIYLHKFLRSDADVPHDHPWWSISMALHGEAKEEVFHAKEWGTGAGSFIELMHWDTLSIKAGDVKKRSPHHIHRLVIDKPFWTLFITGPVIRKWGFWCPSGRFVPWNDFLTVDENVSTAKMGCDD